MLPTTIDIDSQRPDRGRLLADRFEEFAGTFVATRNAARAYRTAFAPDRATAASVIQAEAERLLRDPKMQARMNELIDAAVKSTIINIRAVLVDYHDIATADPNEIISHIIDCCRYCYGTGHAHQWVDMGEYLRAVEDTARKNDALPSAAKPALAEPLPTMEGGFGYWPSNEPHPCCPRCFGRGEGRTVLHDTTKLSPAARKLYKGVKETKNGIEVLMHDQNAARDLLLRVAGALKDGLPLAPPAPEDPNSDAIPGEATETEAGRAYLQMVAGPSPGQ